MDSPRWLPLSDVWAFSIIQFFRTTLHHYSYLSHHRATVTAVKSHVMITIKTIRQIKTESEMNQVEHLKIVVRATKHNNGGNLYNGWTVLQSK